MGSSSIKSNFTVKLTICLILTIISVITNITGLALPLWARYNMSIANSSEVWLVEESVWKSCYKVTNGSYACSVDFNWFNPLSGCLIAGLLLQISVTVVTISIGFGRNNNKLRQYNVIGSLLAAFLVLSSVLVYGIYEKQFHLPFYFEVLSGVTSVILTILYLVKPKRHAYTDEYADEGLQLMCRDYSYRRRK